MATLSSPVSAITRHLVLDDALSDLAGGDILRIDDEVMRFAAYGRDHRSRPVHTELTVDRGVNDTLANSHAASAAVVIGATVAIAPSYDGPSSFQAIAADLELGTDAGNIGTDPKFLAAIMGNALGDGLTKAGAYLAGVIAALSITGTKATDYQVGALLGVVMDGVTEADGAIVAVIDGSDPSSITRANAAFAARMNNNNPGSGVDFGLDLLGPANPNYTGGGFALAIAKAILRTPSGVCVLEGDGVPDGSVGAGFAGPGSVYIRTHSGSVAWYLNTGSIGTPDWKAVTHD